MALERKMRLLAIGGESWILYLFFATKIQARASGRRLSLG